MTLLEDSLFHDLQKTTAKPASIISGTTTFSNKEKTPNRNVDPFGLLLGKS